MIQKLPLMLFALLSSAIAFAQGLCPNSLGSIVPSGSWQTMSTCSGGYLSFSATSGAQYTFTHCSNGGAFISDPYLFISSSPSSGIVASNDDWCGLGSEIVWVAPSSGTFYIHLANYSAPCGGPCRVLAYAITSTTWVGTVSSAWNNAGNWSNGIPGSSSTVVIPAGTPNNPDLGVNATLNNLTVDLGATLTILTGNSITVNGGLINNGTINVESDAALVQGSSSNLSGSGTFNVDRTIPAGAGNAFRFMGSPVVFPAVNSFGVTPTGVDGAQIVSLATCDPAGIDPTSPYGNILQLVESATSPNNCSQELWAVKSAGTLASGQGYSVMTSDNFTHTFSGTVHNGSVTVGSITRQAGTINLPGGGTSTRGWHLIANPYPSPIALTAGNMPGGFDSQVQIWDAANSNWVSINPLGTADIGVGQAFQVRKTAIGGTISFGFSNSLRTTGAPTFYSNPLANLPHVELVLSSPQVQEQHTLFFHQDASPLFDPQFDANRLFGNANGTYLFGKSKNNEGIMENLSFNSQALSELDAPSYSVPVYLKSPYAGAATLQVQGLLTMPSNIAVYLKDEATQLEQLVVDGQSLQVNLSGNEDGHRFTLRFEKSSLFVSEMDNQQISLWSNGNRLRFFLKDYDASSFQWELFSLNGRLLHSGQFNVSSQTTLEAPVQLASGVYLVRLVNAKGEESNLKLLVNE